MKRLDSYSQHFLKSPRLVAELIGHTTIRKNDVVYDLGAGSGIITSVLAGRVKHVFAIEIEPDALKKLHQNLDHVDNVTIVKSDIMHLELPNTPYKIFANIPFHLSSPIVHFLTESDNRPKAIFLIVQKQFANKLLANMRHFTSQLGAELAPLYTARIRKPLRKTDFTPPPAVDTVLLELKLRAEPLISLDQSPRYRAFIKKAFTDQTYFRVIAPNPEKRPSELDGEAWAKLFKAQ